MRMKEKIKTLMMGVAAVATLGTAVAVAPVVSANGEDVDVENTSDLSGVGGKYTKSTTGGDPATGDSRGLMEILNVIINGVLGVIGFVAVVMIIVGGVQYTTSSGDAAKVTKAKNTIMYGVIGLVIALLAFAIVNFVLTNIIGGSGASGSS